MGIPVYRFQEKNLQVGRKKLTVVKIPPTYSSIQVFPFIRNLRVHLMVRNLRNPAQWSSLVPAFLIICQPLEFRLL